MAEIEAPPWIQSSSTLFVGYGAILTVALGLNTLMGPFRPLFSVIILLSVGLIWTFIWFRFRIPPPRNVSDKFGICLLIVTEDDRMRARLENDIIRRLNELIAAHDLEPLITLVIGTNTQARKYSPFLTEYRHKINQYKQKDPPEKVPADVYRPFDKFQKRTRSHFFIWGTLTERQEAILGGEVAYNLATDALIVHSDLLPAQQQILSQQFLRWLKEIRVDRRMENPGLKVGAEDVYLITSLVIGSAAALVGNVSAGYAIHAPLLNILKPGDPDPHHQAIRKHVVRMIADECQYLGRSSIDANPEQAREFLNKSLEANPRHYSALLSRAVLEYVVDGDINAAIATIDLAKTVSQGDGAWRYSKAFLQIASGEYKDSLRTYQEITKQTFRGEEYTLQQVIQFNLLRADGGFLPSYFILGLLAYKKVKNLPMALLNFEKFIEQAEADGPYKLLVSRALGYKDDLLSEMA
jgi:tetratricopeptide (TPR) repeat protein